MDTPNDKTGTPPLRAGLIACGGIAPLTLDAAARSPDFDVVAIQDPDEGALRITGDRYGIGPRHQDVLSLLAEDLDFVVVNSPNHLHLEHVRLAAAAGKHCLVQKPMARTADEAREMIRVAEGHGVRLGVTMFEIGKPLHHEVRAMIRSGWFGEPVLVQAVGAHDIYLKAPPPEDDWRRDPTKVGGAAFIQLAVHQLNLACWLFEDHVVAAQAIGAQGRTVFGDETTLATVKFTGGALGHFAASYATSLYSVTLCGTRGRIQLTSDNVILRGDTQYEGEVLIYGDPRREAVISMGRLAPTLARRRDEVEVHGQFARWLMGHAEFPCTAESAFEDLKVVDAVYRSRAKEGTWFDIG